MKKTEKPQNPETRLVTSGRDPENNHGFVNPPVYHASTVLYPTLEAIRKREQDYTYGRTGTPTTESLQDAIASIEGGHGTRLTSSGLGAITVAYFAFVEAGDHILVADTVYRPNRVFCDRMLRALGVETTYYDPLIGAGIAEMMRPNTKVVFAETPGSQTFEMLDLPAVAQAAHDRGAVVIVDNTWASPLFCNPFAQGADVSIQAGTKYIVGHSDAMLGAVSANEEHFSALKRAWETLGQCAGPDDAYLGQRGIRTLDVRLRRHMENGIALAEWLEQRPEVERVLHPALPSHPGHEIWQRNFTGASGLFSAVLNPVSEQALAAMLDDLELFGMGYSWGGYESLVVPFDPVSYRTATHWPSEGPALRFHAGLENIEDLKADLEAGFERMNALR